MIVIPQGLNQVTFDQQQFIQHLQTRWFGHPLYYFETLASTNSSLWRLIDQGAGPGTAVIAAQQQVGRGQWGRTWCSPPGGLYLSLAVITHGNTVAIGTNSEITATQAAQLTFASAWGIATTLRNQGIPIRLKWPNDLLVQRRKLGGILTETRLHQGKVHTAVVGVGLNWSNPVPASGINLQTILKARKQPPQPDSLECLTAMILQGLEMGYCYWQTAGIEALLTAYLALLQNLGDSVEVKGHPGKIVGVAANGDLRVQLLPAAPLSGLETELEISCPPGSIRLGTSV